MLSDEYRWPTRTAGEPLNYASLAAPPPPAYLLGNGDILEVTVPELMQRGEAQPFQVQVLESGEAYFPRVGPIQVGGLTLAQAQYQINSVLAAGYLQNPGASIALIQKGTINVVVLGAVKSPGIHALPRYENDVAHALAAAGGFDENAGEVIEIHRQSPLGHPSADFRFGAQPTPAMPSTFGGQSVQALPLGTVPMNNAPAYGPMQSVIGTQPTYLPGSQSAPSASPHDSYRAGHSLQPGAPLRSIRGQSPDLTGTGPLYGYPTEYPHVVNRGPILKIRLRGNPLPINPDEMVLQPGDVVVVPRKTDEVFYVVGPLSEQSRIRFSVGDRDREIGNGLLLPPDREVDVVTAVAMAGYIDPIESPTTVTVHRCGIDGMPLLIRVDLIAARSDPQETVLIQPGDIIYLNPDHWWYTRRLIDRVIDQALGTAIGRWLTG